MKTLLITSALFFSIPAMAYVDPGSGYMLWQVLMSAVVGVCFGIWQWVSHLFKKRADQKSNFPNAP